MGNRSKNQTRQIPPAKPRPPQRGGTAEAGKLKTEPDVSFDLSMFSKLIEGKALTFRWSRAVRCPCVDETSGAFDPTHVACRGRGWQYVHPFARQHRYQVADLDYIEVPAAFSSGTQQEERQNVIGLWRNGRGQITVQGAHRVAPLDRFVGIDQRMPWTEVLLRDTALDVVPVGRMGRSTDEQQTAFRYRPIEVHAVIGRDVQYWEGVDYDLRRETKDEPPKLVWREGEGPADGDRYAVHYLCHPVWVVDSAAYLPQHLYGWPNGIRGPFVLQDLPTTWDVALDFIADQVGT